MATYIWTDKDFEELSWHDNHVHALRVIEGQHGLGSLVLDLDYITEWVRQGDNTIQFRILPSTLTFFEVCNLRISLDYAEPTAALSPFSIHEIRRTLEKRDRYVATLWHIEVNWPRGDISFEAKGFEQRGRGSPILSCEQRLTAAERELPSK